MCVCVCVCFGQRSYPKSDPLCSSKKTMCASLCVFDPPLIFQSICLIFISVFEELPASFNDCLPHHLRYGVHRGTWDKTKLIGFLSSMMTGRVPLQERLTELALPLLSVACATRPVRMSSRMFPRGSRRGPRPTSGMARMVKPIDKDRQAAFAILSLDIQRKAWRSGSRGDRFTVVFQQLSFSVKQKHLNSS